MISWRCTYLADTKDDVARPRGHEHSCRKISMKTTKSSQTLVSWTSKQRAIHLASHTSHQAAYSASSSNTKAATAISGVKLRVRHRPSHSPALPALLAARFIGHVYTTASPVRCSHRTVISPAELSRVL